MTRRNLIGALVAGATALALVTPAPATPVCTGDVPKAVCLGRTVPEPETTSLSFVTFNEFRDALDDLAAEFPGYLAIETIGSSVNDHDVLLTEVTDPESPVPYEDREVVYIAQSIHGNEAGGREGMIRVIEDLLRATDPETETLLNELRLVQFVPNTDGWVRGDWDRNGTTYRRGNGNGTDLNRQFPWKGWIPDSRQPLSEPEAQAVADETMARVEAGERLVASADIHGMGQNQAAVWSMLSSGEFDLAGMVRQRTHGERVEAAVEDALSPRALFVLGEAANGAVVPHVLTSSSEFQGGLSGSGFLGDWLAQKDGGNTASLSTIELFVNQPQHSFTYAKEIVQIQVEAVRAIVRTLMEEALEDPGISLRLPGAVGYIHDPLAVDGATPMAFFDDLAPFVDGELRRIRLDDFHDPEAGDPFAELSSLVVTSDLALGDADAMERIGAFVEGGGNLVLTDAGLRLLAALDTGIDDADVTKANTVISNASFVDLEHEMAAGVRENALHLYEPATLGYNSETATQSPVWRVARSAFDAAGTTVATTDGQTSVGVRTLGAGTVHAIGGLLPPPVDVNKVLYGLNDYALTDTGYLLLINALGADVLEDGARAGFDTVSGEFEPDRTAVRD